MQSSASRATKEGGRIRGPLRITAAQQQPRSLPHPRTAQEPEVGLRTVSTHASRTLDRHVSIESWEEELKGRRQHSAAVRRAHGSSSITPWRRSSAGLPSRSAAPTLDIAEGRVIFSLGGLVIACCFRSALLHDYAIA